MNYAYCLPLLKSDKKEIFAAIQQQKEHYKYFEVWLDYVDGMDTIFLQELTADLGDRLVVVCRRQNMDPIQMSLAQRYELLDSLHNSRVLVDLDVEAQQAELDYIRKKNISIRTIASYHNYQQTPESTELKGILQRIRRNNPEILKIATQCQNENDALRLLEILLSLKKTEEKYIILGMGEHGLITRIFGPLWGNALVFAPEKAAEQSAPGQITRARLDKVLEVIGE